MKAYKIMFLLLATLALGFTFAACGGHSHDHSEESAEQGKEYTSAYIWPMHCEGSGSAEPGKCPVCKMDYVANEEYDTEELETEGDGVEDHGHEHDGEEEHGHEHDGHNHDGHEH